MKRTALVLVVLAIVGGACAKKTSTVPTVTGSTGQKPTVTVPSGSPPKELQIKDITVGTGTEAKTGSHVTVQYVGVNFADGKEFDASWNSGKPFDFNLGAGQVIKGWDQGVVGMKVGGRRELIIPPALGYGVNGSPPVIQPNETLVFVVDLVKVE